MKNLPSSNSFYSHPSKVMCKQLVLKVYKHDSSEIHKLVLVEFLIDRQFLGKNIFHKEVLTINLIDLNSPNYQEFSFSAYYVPASSFEEKEKISLTGGHVFIPHQDCRGYRIGSWVMNQIVIWASQWPNADIAKISLGDGDATPENKVRRNKFYEGFGIKFHYFEDDKLTGYSLPMKSGDLNINQSWDKISNGNIEVVNIVKFIKETTRELHDINKKLNLAVAKDSRIHSVNNKTKKTSIYFVIKSFFRNED